MRSSPLSALLGGLLCLSTSPALAQSDECGHERELSARMEMTAGTPLRVSAGAGSLVVRGVDGLREARVRGTVCATSAALAQEVSIRTEREQGSVVIETVFPEQSGSRQYARMNLVVEVPLGTSAVVIDGSGSAELSGLGDLDLNDGSGEVAIEDVTGTLAIHDGSGSIEIHRVGGDIRITDGSGEVVIRDTGGNVRITDGSGSIRVDRVRGDLVITEGGTGDVDWADVSGRVDVPRRRRGGTH